MKTLVSESYNIAWFKLADFVTRGEKERALNLLRLLMHSINNPALTLQLEGDILLAFDDQTAFLRYQNAALLFQKTDKFQEAIGICQHALTFKDDEKILEIMLESYISMNNTNGIKSSFIKLTKLFINKNQTDQLIIFTHQMCNPLNTNLQTILYSQLLIAILLYHPTYEKLTEIIAIIINMYQKSFHDKTITTNLTKFLAEVKAVDIKVYDQIKGSLYG